MGQTAPDANTSQWSVAVLDIGFANVSASVQGTRFRVQDYWHCRACRAVQSRASKTSSARCKSCGVGEMANTPPPSSNGEHIHTPGSTNRHTLSAFVPPLSSPTPCRSPGGWGGTVIWSTHKFCGGSLCCAPGCLPLVHMLAGHFESLSLTWNRVSEPCFLLGQVWFSSAPLGSLLRGRLLGNQSIAIHIDTPFMSMKARQCCMTMHLSIVSHCHVFTPHPAPPMLRFHHLTRQSNTPPQTLPTKDSTSLFDGPLCTTVSVKPPAKRAKPPPKGAAQSIPVQSSNHVEECKLKWTMTKNWHTANQGLSYVIAPAHWTHVHLPCVLHTSFHL